MVPKIKTELHKITVVILTYERHNYLTTCLSYWNQYPISIVIVDGSEKPYLMHSGLEAKVDYTHMPSPWETRLRFASTRIETDYVIICPDDEFHSFEALQNGVEILASEPKVSAVCGEVTGFATLGQDFMLKKQYQNHLLDITGSTAYQRFARRRSIDDSIVFYSLMRRSLMELAANFISDEIYACPYVAEAQMEAILCAAGEIKIVPMVFWFRNRNSKAVSYAGYDRSMSLGSWLRDSNNTEQIKKLSELSTKYFLAASNGDGSLTGENFLVTHVQQEEAKLARRAFGQNLSLRNVALRVYFYFPVTMKRVIRRGLIFLFGQTDSGLFEVERYLGLLTERKILYNRGEISRICTLVVEYERLMRRR